MINELPQEFAKFRTWRQVTDSHNDKPVRRTTLIDVVETKTAFATSFTENLALFRDHQYRVDTQNRHFGLLKAQLKLEEATIQVDFAENYVCRFKAEVAAAYFSKKQVTIHPCVRHYRTEEMGPVLHRTVAILSDVTSHKAQTIFAFVSHPGPLPVRLTVESVQERFHVPCRPQPPGHLQRWGDMELL